MAKSKKDRVAPAKKAPKEQKNPGPRLKADKLQPQPGQIGHNSQEIPELKGMMDEYLASCERQKAEAKLQRDIRNRAKTEFGVLSSAWAHEVRLRKMDEDVRVQFEEGHKDLKCALGYQLPLFADSEYEEHDETQAEAEQEHDIDPDLEADVQQAERKFGVIDGGVIAREG